MRGQHLLDAMEGIDVRYIQDADNISRPKTPLWLRVVAAAACVCLLACGVWQGARWYTVHSAMLDGTAVALPQGDFATSDAYDTLDELLTDLSDGEEHRNLRGDGVDIPATAMQKAKLTEGQSAVAYKGYSYHLVGEQINISALSGTAPQAVGVINLDTDVVQTEMEQHVYGSFTKLFLREERLIAVSNLTVVGKNLPDSTYYTVVTVYNLAEPTVPVVFHRYVQLGSLTQVYMTGDGLMLMTADGVCACGWSRLKNTDEYIPQLNADGEDLVWTDEELHVLGAPTMVQYIAVTQIDTASATVTDRHAFYGWITDVYYGADWFALSVVDEVNTLYTFTVESGIQYTGVLTMPDPDFARTSVYSVVKHGDIYRVIGQYSTGRGGNMKTYLLGMTADIRTGKCRYQLRLLEQARLSSLSEIYWENDRAVIVEEGALLFAEFYGMAVRLYESLFEADSILGVDGWYWGGHEPKTMMNLSNGIYLRFNSSSDGLELWDLSRSDAPVKHLADTLLSGEERLGFHWMVYDAHTVGVAVVIPDENGKYHHGNMLWHIYHIDRRGSVSFERLAVYDLQTVPSSLPSDSRFTSFEYNNQHYITTRDVTVPLAVSW